MKEVTLRAQKLGHAVLKVRSLAQSMLGLTEVARYGTQMAFFLVRRQSSRSLADTSSD